VRGIAFAVHLPFSSPNNYLRAFGLIISSASHDSEDVSRRSDTSALSFLKSDSAP
jgi:hypothetical protein